MQFEADEWGSILLTAFSICHIYILLHSCTR